MEDSAEATLDLVEAMHTLHPRVDSVADAPWVEAAHSTAVAGITVAEDIMAPASDSASEFTRLTDMPLRSVIPPDSMLQTARGNIIRVALCPTDIKLDGRAATPRCVAATAKAQNGISCKNGNRKNAHRTAD